MKEIPFMCVYFQPALSYQLWTSPHSAKFPEGRNWAQGPVFWCLPHTWLSWVADGHPPAPRRPSWPQIPQEPYKVGWSTLTALPPPSTLPRLSITVLWLTARGAWRWPLVPPVHLADGP